MTICTDELKQFHDSQGTDTVTRSKFGNPNSTHPDVVKPHPNKRQRYGARILPKKSMKRGPITKTWRRKPGHKIVKQTHIFSHINIHKKTLVCMHIQKYSYT